MNQNSGDPPQEEAQRYSDSDSEGETTLKLEEDLKPSKGNSSHSQSEDIGNEEESPKKEEGPKKEGMQAEGQKKSSRMSQMI